MRTSRRLLLPALTALLSLNAAPAQAGGKVKVSGWVATAPFNSRVGSLENVGIQLLNVGVDPAVVLASGPLNASDPNCLPALCPWSFDNVDLSKVKIGFAVAVGDVREKDKAWVPAVTLTASPAHLTEARKTGVLEKQYVLAINQGGLTALGRVAGRPATEVLKDGVFLGTALGRKNELNPMTGFPPMISGATLNGPPGAQIFYPNKKFTHSAAATTDIGTFMLVPKVRGQGNGSYQIVAPAGDSHTWVPLPITMQPDVLLMVFFPAQDAA